MSSQELLAIVAEISTPTNIWGLCDLELPSCEDWPPGAWLIRKLHSLPYLGVPHALAEEERRYAIAAMVVDARDDPVAEPLISRAYEESRRREVSISVESRFSTTGFSYVFQLVFTFGECPAPQAETAGKALSVVAGRRMIFRGK